MAIYKCLLIFAVVLVSTVSAHRNTISHSKTSKQARMLAQEIGTGDVKAKRTQDSSLAMPQDKMDKGIDYTVQATPGLSAQVQLVDSKPLLPDPTASDPSSRRVNPRNLAQEKIVQNTLKPDPRHPEPLVLRPTVLHTASIVLIHGLGDSASGTALGIATAVSPDLPYVKFIMPTAPTQEVTVNKGAVQHAWYDIYSFNKISDKQDVNGLWASARYIQTLVEAEIVSGIPSTRIMVVGISQGGALALVSLREDIKLAGVLSLSGYLTLGDQAPIVSGANAQTPVLMCQGTDDLFVSYQEGLQAYEKMKLAGANVQFKSYPGLGHMVGVTELLDAKAFMKLCLPPVTNPAVTGKVGTTVNTNLVQTPPQLN